MKNIKGDIFGGITAGIVALPLALAFGVQSGMGAEAGLYGAIFLGIFASLFGGTPSQISGPTGPMTVITSGLVAMYAINGELTSATLGFLLGIFILSGIFQIIFGLIKIGQYIRYIPYPVLSGFMSGIGVIIILLQIFPLLGVESPKKTLDIIQSLPLLFQNINPLELILGSLTIAIIYFFPKITKAVPSTLVALLISTLLAFFLKWDVKAIGNIPVGLPSFHFNDIISMDPKMIFAMIIPALTLAGLGTIDTLLTSVVADNITQTKHNSNKELIGQGIGNTISGFFGGIPGAGATMRTLVNVKAGGRGKISGIIHGAFLVGILLGLGSLVAYIPFSVLAGILLTVGIGIIDKKGIKDILFIPRADAIILVLVLVLTVFVDLLQAVGLGMVLASVLFMKRASDLVDSGINADPISGNDKEITWDDEMGISEDIRNKIYIQRLDGPLFFGSVSRFQQIMNGIPDNVEVVIIRMRKVPFIDQSGLYALETAILNLKNKNKTVLMTIIQPQPLYMMEKVNLIPSLLKKEHTFKSFEECSQFLKVFLKKMKEID
ncbi:MAG: sodium-independent anion transporter [Bacteroidetes bacterium HGW-Bacteroidetes-21]|nr:MAG: sodium-independent anion transporter [Bacteroidetes bacterium HGW-Bacteroidetes-21]